MTEYKIVVMGGGGVGKSSIAIQFVQNQFVIEYDATIEDSYRKQSTVDKEEILFDILDTAGQEEYSAMRDRYIHGGQGFLCVYSITSRQSLDEIITMREQILRVKDLDKVPMILIGNKSDLTEERRISIEEGKEMAKSWHCPFFETSAKNRIHVDEVFFQIIREIKKYYQALNQPRIVKKKKKDPCYLL